ncbi:MAG: transcriptional repressor [Cloacibacillus sp.]
MGTRGRYRTKNHETLLALLKEHPARCFSVDDLCGLLEARGAKIGRTTVYRQLEALASDNAVLKYIAEKGDGATYRLGAEGCAAHLHLKCLDCGGVTHLDCGTADDFSRHLKEDHSFSLDPARTVIYGHCGCTEGGAANDAKDSPCAKLAAHQ